MAAKKKKKKAAKRGRPPKRAPGAKKTGRPTKLTPRLRDEMASYMLEGNYLEVAAAMCNVSKQSVYQWLKAGHRAKELQEKDKPLSDEDRAYMLFLDAIKRAEADAETSALRQLNAQSKGAWQILAWRLERRHPDRWGRRQAIEHSSPEDKPVKVQRIVIGGQKIEF